MLPKGQERSCVSFPIEIPTQKDGDASVFLTMDVYAEYMFYTGIEQDQNKSSILKHVQLLMDNEVFQQHKDKPFTLVFHKFEELRKDIESIIQSHNGRMVVDEDYVAQKMMPVVEDFFKHLSDSG